MQKESVKILKFKKNLGKYHDLYLKSNGLLLAGIFENFRKIRFIIYHRDPLKYFSAPGLA